MELTEKSRKSNSFWLKCTANLYFRENKCMCLGYVSIPKDTDKNLKIILAKNVHLFTIYSVHVPKATDKILKIIQAKLSKTLLKCMHFSSTFIRLLVKIQSY